MKKTKIELNILVAEKIFGHRVVRKTWGKKKQYRQYSVGEPDYYDDQGMTVLSNPVPNYSEDIKDAWEIVDYLRDKNYAFSLATLLDTTNNENKLLWIAKWEMHDPDYRFVFEISETVAEAICKASLKSVENK